MNERRYDEDEVAEILDRATATDGSLTNPRDGSSSGLTLAGLTR